MIERILVAVDIDAAKNSAAMDCARDIASKLGADLTVVHITRSAAAAEKNTDISHHKDAIPIGNMLQGLAARIESKNIDLVLFIDKALSGIGLNRLPDTGMKLLKQTRAPVMLIRSNQLNGKRGKLIKKIMVPLDGTEDTGTIVALVTQIASAFSADVILLNVVAPEGREPVVASSTFLNHQSRIIEEKHVLSSHYLSKIAGQFRLGHEEINVVCETRIGSAAEEIAACADDLEVDLMAMSTRGNTGLRRWVFGSTATEVIRRYNKNLLLISQ